MDTGITAGMLWDRAAKNGIILGLFTAVCRLGSQAVSLSGSAVLVTAAGFVIWALQFCGCIWLMYTMMKRITVQFPSADNRTVARYGTMLSLTSALVFSAAMLADVLYIFPGMVKEQMDIYYNIYGAADSNTLSMLKKIEENYPQILFFSTLTYSFLYGTVLSRIISSRIPAKDPFRDFMKKNEQD